MKTFIGDACAYIAAEAKGGKAKYLRIGSAMQDDKDQRISLKIDTLPLTGSGWQGWINIFPPKEAREKPLGEDVDNFTTGTKGPIRSEPPF